MFAVLTEPYEMIQVSISLQPHRTVLVNFVPGNFLFVFGEPLAATRLKSIALEVCVALL